MVQYFIILLVKGTLIYRVAYNLSDVQERSAYDANLPEVIPLGYCSSVDWVMEWYTDEESGLRQRVSDKVLELINYIRQHHLA